MQKVALLIESIIIVVLCRLCRPLGLPVPDIEIDPLTVPQAVKERLE